MYSGKNKKIIVLFVFLENSIYAFYMASFCSPPVASCIADDTAHRQFLSEAYLQIVNKEMGVGWYIIRSVG